jgi:two-component system chemotaxis response regulator CheY
MLFASKGFSITKAINGERAVKEFKEANPKPDIILMDHRMPIKNGLEASKEILQFDPTAKIIFISADRSIKNEAVALGALDFVEKPFDFSFLLNRINEILTIV